LSSGIFGRRDGFEIAGDHIIANRGDGVGPYDLYDLNGTLITADFIDPTPFLAGGCDTGITFDGTDYIISSPANCGAGSAFNNLLVFDLAGDYVRTVTLTGPLPPDGIRLLEDLSSLENVPSNTAVPEPATLTLTALGLAGVVRRCRRRRASRERLTDVSSASLALLRRFAY